MSLLSDLLAQVDNTISALTGDQTITGTAGNDLINSLLGSNLLNGGAGNDIVSYSTQSQGIVANLALGTVSDFGETTADTLISIENVIGSNFADVLIAFSGSFLEGGGGADILQSLHGGNTLDGGAGIDTASFQGQALGETVNLLTGLAVGDHTDVLANIENLIGTDLDDSLSGDSGDNLLAGAMGDDILTPGGGDDTMTGGMGFDIADLSGLDGPLTVSLQQGVATVVGSQMALSGIEGVIGTFGDDMMSGDTAANSLTGGDGDDTLNGGLFRDTLDGGDGHDTTRYDDAASGVSVDLQAGQASGGDDNDILISIEDVSGSAFADIIRGAGFANHLQGGGGDDLLEGRGGADTLDGGAGLDTVTYANAASAVAVDLTAGSAAGGDGADSLAAIENVIGSGFDDLLVGDAGANRLVGLAGVDALSGGGGGDDTLDGGNGFDTATFAGSAAGVTADLFRHTASGAGSDTLIEIENLTGSAMADSLFGDGGINRLSGGGGDDLLAGRAGADTLDGGTGTDTARYQGANRAVSVDLSAGTARVGASTDILISIENADGGRFADTLVGDGADNVLRGFGGADSFIGRGGGDTLEGGGGRDTVSYAGVGDKVVVLLAEDLARGGGGADTLIGIENVIGSDFGDALIGDDKHNVLDGGDGNDRLGGGRGHDILTGGAGADLFIFTAIGDSAKHGAFDLITDLNDADTIDLSGIDANTGADGDQSFHLVDRFTHQAGEMTLSYKAGMGVTLLNLDVNGDGVADSVIHITGDVTSFSQFIL